MITERDKVRFYDRICPEPNTGCWLWIGAPDSFGYGQIEINGASYRTHRLSWMIHRGEITKGLVVCHRCDTPACVNPDHLFLGTHGDNVRDMHKKGRNRPATKRCDPAIVQLAYLLRDHGNTYPQISEWLRVPHRTIMSWVARDMRGPQ